jgi:hypothetical protein
LHAAPQCPHEIYRYHGRHEPSECIPGKRTHRKAGSKAQDDRKK